MVVYSERKRRLRPVSISLHPREIARLDEICEKAKIPRSALLRMAVAAILEGYEAATESATYTMEHLHNDDPYDLAD